MGKVEATVGPAIGEGIGVSVGTGVGTPTAGLSDDTGMKDNPVPATRIIAPTTPIHFCRSRGISTRPANRPANAKSMNTNPTTTRIVGTGVSFTVLSNSVISLRKPRYESQSASGVDIIIATKCQGK